MRIFGLILAMFWLTACAAPTSDSRPDPSQKAKPYSAQDHIPPPPFKDDATDLVIGQSCGGMVENGQNACTAPETYCHRDIKDMCGAADAPGVCRKKPMACPEDFNPVCGCDGQTYPNECAANRAGVSAAQRGRCPA